MGAEAHSLGLDFSDAGRNVSVIFGDGAGAVVLQPTKKEGQGILSTHLHSNGDDAELLSMMNPGFHSGKFVGNKRPEQPRQPYGGMFTTNDPFPSMDGQLVFKKAIEKFPEVICEALTANNLQPGDINLLIPHQANLRISKFIQHKMKLRDDQVHNNIEKYGNTTAASIPIALYEALDLGKIQEGDLVCLAAFGSGFTWGSVLLRW